MRTKSKKPNKQRYYQYNIPKHENHKLLSASVSKKLKQEKGLKSLPIREGDEVLIVRGSHKGKSGKVNKTDPVKSRIYVDGLGSKKTDAQEIAIPIHPSNVVIQKIYGKDKYRREQLIARRIADKSKMEEVLSISGLYKTEKKIKPIRYRKIANRKENSIDDLIKQRINI